MDWKTLSSSLISAAAYDQTTGDLTLEFHSGRRYLYSNVHPDLALKLFSADSTGSFFHSAIKPYFQGTEISDSD